MVRFRKILCPVDFFPASLRAYDYALKLASNYGAKVHAMHVVAPVIPAAYGAPYTAVDLTTDLEKESRRMLQRLTTKAERVGVSVENEVRVGDIDIEIRSAIEDEKADLVVMGTHGRRGFERWVMGSVTERVMRHSPVPVLTIGLGKNGRSTSPQIRRILVTTDFSAGTSEAIDYAVSIAEENKAKVTLLHVASDLTVPLGSKGTNPLITSIMEKLGEIAPQGVEIRIETGEPYRAILDVIDSERPSMVVMNIHGKSLVERALIGSTAERVVRAASEMCPVLLIPPMRSKARTIKTIKKRKVA